MVKLLTPHPCLQHRFINAVIFIFKNIHVCINLLDITAFVICVEDMS